MWRCEAECGGAKQSFGSRVWRRSLNISKNSSMSIFSIKDEMNIYWYNSDIDMTSITALLKLSTLSSLILLSINYQNEGPPPF